MRKVLKQGVSSGLELVRIFFKTLLDLVYPPVCCLCQSRLLADEKLVCKICWQDLPVLITSDERTPLTLTHQQNIAQFLAVWKFEGQVPQLIHLFKYRGFTRLAEGMGNRMAQLCQSEPEYARADGLVAVPLHSARYRERGYNQSLLLCRRIAEITGIPVIEQTLVRIRNTPTQTRFTSVQRAHNVATAFQVIHPERIRGKTIILVDDVATTGATLDTCAHALHQAGVVKVLVLTAIKA
jgi:ComF family protein